MNNSFIALIQRRVYYGWLIVAVALLGFFVSSAFLGLVLSLFLEPMSGSYGWTRTETIGPIAAGTLAAALSAPFLGRIVDRFGARVPMMLGALVGGGVLVLMPWIGELWQFFLLYGVIGAIARENIGGVVINTCIANWFVRKRGRALAIATMGIPLGGALLVPLLQYVISVYGWQAAWVTLGVLMWALILVPAGLIMRRHPEDLGLRPDGDQLGTELSLGFGVRRPRSTESLAPETDWRPREALRTPAFWSIFFIFGPLYVGPFAILAHIFPYLSIAVTNIGVASVATSVFAFSGIPARVFWGLLTERLHIRYCAALHLLFSGTAISLLLLARSDGMIFLAVLFCGVTLGGGMVLKSVLLPAYFGRRYIGSITGLMAISVAIAVAGGPLVAAWFYDTTGRYLEAFLLFIGTLVVGGCLMFFTKPPKPTVPCLEMDTGHNLYNRVLIQSEETGDEQARQ